MKEKKAKQTIKIYDDTHELLKRISQMEDRFMVGIVHSAVKLYHETMFKKRNW